MVDIIRTIEQSIDFRDKELWNKMNWMVTRSPPWQLDLEVNCQVARRQIKDNLENGKKYVGFTKTSYLNMMLDKQVLRTEERPAGHMSFLPQEVVRHEVWTRGLQRRHSYKQQSPHIEMQSTTHPNGWVQYTS